jgi:hypothetical protein
MSVDAWQVDELQALNREYSQHLVLSRAKLVHMLRVLADK